VLPGIDAGGEAIREYEAAGLFLSAIRRTPPRPGANKARDGRRDRASVWHMIPCRTYPGYISTGPVLAAVGPRDIPYLVPARLYRFSPKPSP